jgi:hypothetical protein
MERWVSAFAVLVGIVATLEWTLFTLARNTPTVQKMRDRAERSASESREKGYRIRFEYLQAWLIGSRLRSGIAACTYLLFTLWFASITAALRT